MAIPSGGAAGRGRRPAHHPDALSWLLRRSVRRYRAPVTAALQRAGFEDLPQRGVWALSALVAPGVSARDLVARMDITKQSVGEVVDTLVALGYVERLPYPDDRRRTLLALTQRGRAAARVIDDAVAEVEASMERAIGTEQMRALGDALEALDRS